MTNVLCELDGDYSVTYKDIKKTYLAEGIELFKNLARQTQQSLFLLRRAKTNFAEEDWQKSSLYVVQYWELDSEKEISMLQLSAWSHRIHSCYVSTSDQFVSEINNCTSGRF